MRITDRNLHTIRYANYRNKQVLTEEGYDTGEYEIEYYDKKELEVSLSPETGTFYDGYVRTIVVDDPECDIDEHTVLFIETNKPQHNYIVRTVSRGLYSTKYTIKKVEDE